MRFTVAFIIFVTTLLMSAQAGSKSFNFGGWSGVVESMGRIDGVESENHDEISSKAEQTLKKIIEKHLAGKKQAKQQARKQTGQIPAQQQQQQAAPVASQQQQQQQQAPVAQQQVAPIAQQEALLHELPQSINWNEHKDTRDAINAKVPGGTEAVDALIKLLNEKKTQ